MGRTPATNDEWREYYERAARARSRFGDPFERHMKALRRRNVIFNVLLVLLLVGLSAVLTAFVFSTGGAR